MAQAKRKEKADDTASAESVELHSVDGDWRPQPLSNRARGIVAAVVVLFNIPLIHYFVFRGPPSATQNVPYQNDFSNPASVTADFWSSGGHYRVVDGWLLSPGVKNNPLWLKAKLPQNVAIDFDVKSMSPEGDIKVEIFGDGSDHASGYVLIHGGWNNSLSIIARLDEHGLPIDKVDELKADTRTRVENKGYPVQVGRSYHWRIERRMGTRTEQRSLDVFGLKLFKRDVEVPTGLITWFIDGQKYMEFNDPNPLTGKWHDRMGFSSWEAQLFFDNLRVEPL